MQHWEIESIFIRSSRIVYIYFFIVLLRAALTILSPFFSIHKKLSLKIFFLLWQHILIWKARLRPTKWKQMNEFLLNEQRATLMRTKLHLKWGGLTFFSLLAKTKNSFNRMTKPQMNAKILKWKNHHLQVFQVFLMIIISNSWRFNYRTIIWNITLLHFGAAFNVQDSSGTIFSISVSLDFIFECQYISQTYAELGANPVLFVSCRTKRKVCSNICWERTFRPHLIP